MPSTASDLPANHDPETPNHMIFWLDATIGVPTEYVHLKKAFGSNTDPRCETWTMLTDRDYDKILQVGDAVSVSFEGVQFLLQAFTNEDACLAAFEKHQDKRIFFITSGTMGREVMTRVIENFRNIFTDPISNKPYPSVYVFCHSVGNQMDWAMDHFQFIQMFTHEQDLLQRMTHDIADYFIECAKRLLKTGKSRDALQRLHWAKRLYYQYEKMHPGPEKPTEVCQPVVESKETRELNKLIESIESSIPKGSSDNDDDDEMQCSESCN